MRFGARGIVVRGNAIECACGDIRPRKALFNRNAGEQGHGGEVQRIALFLQRLHHISGVRVDVRGHSAEAVKAGCVILVHHLLVFGRAVAPHTGGERFPEALRIQAALLRKHTFHASAQSIDELFRVMTASLHESGDIIEIIFQECIHVDGQERPVEIEEHGFIAAFGHCGQSFLKGARK